MKPTRRMFAMAHLIVGMAFAPPERLAASGSLVAQPDDMAARAFDDAGADSHAALPAAVAKHALPVTFEIADAFRYRRACAARSRLRLRFRKTRQIRRRVGSIPQGRRASKGKPLGGRGSDLFRRLLFLVRPLP